MLIRCFLTTDDDVVDFPLSLFSVGNVVCTEMASGGGDPNAFAAMYRSHLATLTFNSKPIITNLTVIAAEHVAYMSAVVAKCLDDHIMHSHPSIRLPALYTLDSISKNIGAPYTQLWAERIVPMYLETYKLVDQATKMRMEELLATWKTAGHAGRPLFGDKAQWDIERALFGSQGMPPKPAPAVADPRQSQSKAKAIHDIDNLLTVDGQSLASNPTDQALRERIDSLVQLRQVIVTADLSPEEMNQIHAQLDSLSAAAQKSNPSAHALAMAAAPVPSAPASSAAFPQGLSGALANLSSLVAPGQNQSSTAASSLIASLMQAGLLPGAAPTPAVEQDEEYTKAIMALDIKISGPEFQKTPAASFELILHKHLPLQCRQCANRYPQNEKGQGRMDGHLDWHFTQNRRAKDSSARGQSRSWFDRLENFIRGGYDDAIPTSANRALDDAGQPGGAKSAVNAAQDKAMREKFEKTFVVAPSDPEQASKPCPICKEAFKSQWSEEEEEWIWLNAIKVDGTYYHASCHHSAKSLNDSVAGGTRFGTTPDGRRTGSAGAAKRRSASRAQTPSAQNGNGDSNADPAHSRKRKTPEPHLTAVTEEATPSPAKKIAT